MKQLLLLLAFLVLAYTPLTLLGMHLDDEKYWDIWNYYAVASPLVIGGILAWKSRK